MLKTGKKKGTYGDLMKTNLSLFEMYQNGLTISVHGREKMDELSLTNKDMDYIILGGKVVSGGHSLREQTKESLSNPKRLTRTDHWCVQRELRGRVHTVTFAKNIRDGMIIVTVFTGNPRAYPGGS